MTPELADVDEIEIFAERAAHAAGKTLGVRSDLSLMDQAAAGTVDVFYGIFQRYDVERTLFCEPLRQRRHRRALAAAARSRDQDQSFKAQTALQKRFRDAAFFRRRDRIWEDADGRRRYSVCPKAVQTKAMLVAYARRRKRRVDVVP